MLEVGWRLAPADLSPLSINRETIMNLDKLKALFAASIAPIQRQPQVQKALLVLGLGVALAFYNHEEVLALAELLALLGWL
jgi:energy-converting hydrogenase Eha subunit E